MEEIWKDIKGYEGYYQVSNLGRVKSLERKAKAKGGGQKNIKERILIGKKNIDGYIINRLYKEGKGKYYRVHRLVCLSFIPNYKNKKEVNHKNGIKDDNRLDNLEWATRSENRQHAFDTGLQKGSKGEKNGQSKLTKKDVFKIKYLHKDLRNIDVAKLYNVTKENISMIRNNLSWKHI